MNGTVLECIAFLSTQTEGKWEVKPYEEKRSLSANALYWVMVGQIAKYLHISNARLHNQLLRKYGSPKIVCGEEVWVAIPDTEEAERMVEEDEYNHFQPTMKRIKSMRWYKLLKPSHEFTVSEMSRLIDGTADEMREMGLTPPQGEEIRRAIERYERTHPDEQ